MSTSTLGISKVFILDKYFNELQKFWDTEKRLQDATTANEAVNLQNRLRNLSSGLVGLRNSIHGQHPQGVVGTASGEVGLPMADGNEGVLNCVAATNNFGSSGDAAVVTSTSVNSGGVRSAVAAFENGQLNQVQPSSTQPYFQDDFGTLRSAHSHVTEVSSVMTANVSDPASSSGDGGMAAIPDQVAAVAATSTTSLLTHSNSLCQMSPPQPVSTIQHNYSNIQQPAPMMPTTIPHNPQRLVGPSCFPSNHSPVTGNGEGPFSASGLISGTTGEGGGAFTKSAVRPKTPPVAAAAAAQGGDRLRRRERVTADEARKSALAELSDLIHLEGPFTEDTVVRSLQTRFFNQKYFTNVGPIVLSVNPYRDVGNPLTLTSTREFSSGCQELEKVVQEAIRMQSESGYPQAIIVSGSSGSGKTFTSMMLLRKLFEVAGVGGSHETDTFKHLAAAFTVLRSLCTAKTATNRESSRVGHFIEVQVSDGAMYRTKIHCYFLDQSRVVQPLPMEKNYHIFYQLLAGLTQEERSQLGLEGYTVRDLLYLNMGDTRQDEVADAQRFADWKSNLAVLGIPFMDVVSVFASILLLGNMEFAPAGNSSEEAFDVEIVGKDELNSVAALLGVSTSSLLQGLTSRTHMIRGQPVKSISDANMCNATRNALAKALYCRTIATIVRRANSLKRPVGPLSGTMSSDSNDSVHHEVASHHASTIGTAGSHKSSKSMAILNNAVRHATDGFIGILDMFGFEDSKPSKLEHLCTNLCSETMQHFYNTHIFKSSIESCRDEGISSDVAIDYVDNVPCIDLISSLRTGLLSMLDVECSVRGFPDTYVQKVKVQHKDNKKLFEPKHCDLNRTFGIHHYAGQVVYDTSDFLDTNRDVIPDDLVSIFARHTCQFGFATHLFGNEIKALYSSSGMPQQALPRGALFRISPTSASHPDHQLLNGGDEPVSTLTQDFHTRLDNLLRTLVHAKPHFVRCIRPNEHESLTEFDRSHVTQQIRSLQVLETVNLMAKGFPHRMRFRAFNSRYRMLAKPSKLLFRIEEKAVEDCEIILDCYSRALKQHPEVTICKNNHEWAHGRKHIFLSEGARQQLEKIRDSTRNGAATKIQSVWRGWNVRKRKTMKPKRNEMLKANQGPPQSSKIAVSAILSQKTIPNGTNASMLQQPRIQRPRPQPISGTPPPESESHDRCDFNTIQQTCALFGLDLERPPPVPPSRHYTVNGNRKIAFPQTRLMKSSFADEGAHSDVVLRKGEAVVVIGTSPKRGHLVVEKHNHTVHVPHTHLELKQPTAIGI